MICTVVSQNATANQPIFLHSVLHRSVRTHAYLSVPNPVWRPVKRRHSPRFRQRPHRFVSSGKSLLLLPQAAPHDHDTNTRCKSIPPDEHGERTRRSHLLS